MCLPGFPLVAVIDIVHIRKAQYITGINVQYIEGECSAGSHAKVAALESVTVVGQEIFIIVEQVAVLGACVNSNQFIYIIT